VKGNWSYKYIKGNGIECYGMMQRKSVFVTVGRCCSLLALG
jgi:hypothetical protein